MFKTPSNLKLLSKDTSRESENAPFINTLVSAYCRFHSIFFSVTERALFIGNTVSALTYSDSVMLKSLRFEAIVTFFR